MRMKRKAAILENPQQGLFDLDKPSVVLAPVQMQLAMLVETLLIEIAVVLGTGEESDEQDHR